MKPKNCQTKKRVVFDMKSLNPGDSIISRHGLKLIYVGKIYCPINRYVHEVKYPDGSRGTRSNEGWTFVVNPLPEDHDIVGVVSKS